MSATESQPILSRALVVVAHPDDETIAFGATLQRLDARVVFCTDGAPEDIFFWKPYGSRRAYADMRRNEAVQALANAGIGEPRFLDIVDQQLFRELERAAIELLAEARTFKPNHILTLAYEGGHPDHDCCSFLASWLGRELKIPVWEAPLYHNASGKIEYQHFIDAPSACLVDVSDEEFERKRNMYLSYQSQAEQLASFDPEIECLRRQPEYDYAEPPHSGPLNYEAWGWPITFEHLRAAFEQFTSAPPQPQYEPQIA